MKKFRAIIKWQEYRARRDTLVQLRAMTNRTLRDCNFSPELVREGVKAWPWQMETEDAYRVAVDLSVPVRSGLQSVEQSINETAVEQPEKRKEKSQQLVHRNAA